MRSPAYLVPLLLFILLTATPCAFSTRSTRRHPRALPYPLPALSQRSRVSPPPDDKAVVPPVLPHDQRPLFVDLSALADLLTGHFLYDHIEPHVYAVSKRVAAKVASAVEVRFTSESGEGTLDGMDFAVLTRQLGGSVESHLTDSIPQLFSQSNLSKPSLHAYILGTLSRPCAPPSSQTAPLKCIEHVASKVHHSITTYIRTNLYSATGHVLTYNLPRLVVSTRSEVRRIVWLFNDGFRGKGSLDVVIGDLDVSTLMAEENAMPSESTNEEDWSGSMVKELAKFASMSA